MSEGALNTECSQQPLSNPMPAPLVFCPCWHPGCSESIGEGSAQSPSTCMPAALPPSGTGPGQPGPPSHLPPLPYCHLSPLASAHPGAGPVSSLPGRMPAHSQSPVSPGALASASQTPMQGEQPKPCCQETVSLDSDSLRRQQCGGGRVPFPERGMAGAGLSEMGVDPPPGLVTGYRNPFPALLLVVGPEQRGLRIGAP